MRFVRALRVLAAAVPLLGATACDVVDLSGFNLFGPEVPKPTGGTTFTFQMGMSVRVTGEDMDTLYAGAVDQVLAADSLRSLVGHARVRANRDDPVWFTYAGGANATMDVLVTLSEIATNCAVAGDNPVAVLLKRGETARAEFAVTCAAM
jgi:hypothetical protein